MYNAFYNLIYIQLFYNGSWIDTGEIQTSYNMTFGEYLSSLMALICTITVYIICCLCVYKVIRLFGRLWSRF